MGRQPIKGGSVPSGDTWSSALLGILGDRVDRSPGSPTGCRRELGYL